MTPNEIQTLVTGVSLGVVLMNLLHARWNAQAARRQQTEAEAARKRAAGDLYLGSFRMYRLQNRSRV